MVVNLEVVAKYAEDPEKLIRRFLKKFKKLRILDEIKEKLYYVSPSEERHAADKHKLFVIEKKKEEEAGKK
jgi:ribosomal protein S21